MADFATDRSKRLQIKGFIPEQNWKKRENVSVSENGKTYKVPVDKNIETAVFQIDGEVIKTGHKCDKFLVALQRKDNYEKGIAVFIELKGKDISHAIDQLEMTIKNPLFLPYPSATDATRARIITAGCGPKSSSRLKFEEARIRFKRMYNIELKVLKNSQTDTILNP